MSQSNFNDLFPEDEAAILQEVMNIAFGKASADLADVIDIRVILSVPDIRLMRASELPAQIVDEVKIYDLISIVEQNYWGKFKGTALLIFPTQASKGLVSMFESEQEFFPDAENVMFEKETLLEIGNILIGACVGKIAELLKDIVSYSPPRAFTKNLSNETFQEKWTDSEKVAVFMRTIFSFEENDVSGFLFLILSQDSLKWLKTALNNFMEKYG